MHAQVAQAPLDQGLRSGGDPERAQRLQLGRARRPAHQPPLAERAHQQDAQAELAGQRQDRPPGAQPDHRHADPPRPRFRSSMSATPRPVRCPQSLMPINDPGPTGLARRVGESAQDRTFSGPGRRGVWEAHHAERIEQPQATGENRNEKCNLKG